MDDYVKVNRELTSKLVLQNKENGLPDGTHKRHENISIILSKYADKSKPVLEIGVREGYLFDHLKKAGFVSLYGVDVSYYAIESLHERGYEGQVGDVQNLDIDGSYSTVIMSHCLEHCPDPKKAINNIHNIMDADGVLYVEVPKQPKEPVPTPWGHFYCFVDIEDLKSFFSKDKWILLYEHEKINKNRDRGNIICVYRRI